MGIDGLFVSELVERFYERIRGDALLGPIFADRISDWPVHLEQMKRFWRSVLFSSGEFFGSPMAKHVTIAGLDRSHFVHWLNLFRQTLRELGGEDAREHVEAKARIIATSLLNGIIIHRGGGLGLRAEESLS
ncbi:group III truncated hemoglobin [Sphingomonas sp. GCM10030256]|uniref:group III truncated hemoglobin n=1 Tax=Sphingomonas sp. GCM10030256 TaxID=3273427 RepID=UPI00360B8926